MGDRCNLVKNFDGTPLKLELKLEQEFVDKKYDLYAVCKVVEKDGEKEYIKLYSETFTPEQVRAFHSKNRYYLTDEENEEEI